jgi:hypothetical protein
VTKPVDSSSGNDRLTEFFYDWRNRQTVVRKTVQSGIVSPSTYTLERRFTYDNRDNVVLLEEYDTRAKPGSAAQQGGSVF